jgi:hypothetical protein
MYVTSFLFKEGYTLWFSKTIINTGEKGKKDCCRVIQRSFSLGYDQGIVNKWATINTFSKHITTTNLALTTNGGTNWTINTQGSIESITNEFTTKEETSYPLANYGDGRRWYRHGSWYHHTSRWRTTSLWRNEMNLILNRYLIKDLYLFRKLLLLQNMLVTYCQQVQNWFN